MDPFELMGSASFFFSYFTGIFKPIEFQVWGQDLDLGYTSNIMEKAKVYPEQKTSDYK